MKFYLGTREPQWLYKLTDVPLFLSTRRLSEYKNFSKKATTEWALDSGGFTEISLYGRWTTTPEEYVEKVYFYREKLGGMNWAAAQDWMCEPQMLKKTGKTVREHQKLTIANFLRLKELAPDLPWAPVLQGWLIGDYIKCAEMYLKAGVDLRLEAIVGLGSVCRRQGIKQFANILSRIQSEAGPLRLHGFGVKTQGLKNCGNLLVSSDSMAWSFRMNKWEGCKQPHKKCGRCLDWALAWRRRVLGQEA